MGKTIDNIAGLDMSHDWVEIYSRHLECSKCGVFQAEDAPPVGYPCPENGKESDTIRGDNNDLPIAGVLCSVDDGGIVVNQYHIYEGPQPKTPAARIGVVWGQNYERAFLALPDLLRAAIALLEEELADERSKDKEMYAKIEAVELALEKAGVEI
jgi:hypothetical protein